MSCSYLPHQLTPPRSNGSKRLTAGIATLEHPGRPATVRRLLVEAAWQAIRREARVRAYFERVQRGDAERKKIALVATAHYLVRCMHAMLRTGEVWRGSEDTQPAAVA